MKKPLFSAVILILWAVTPAGSAPITWTGTTGGSGLWEDAPNWDTALAPVPDSDAIFRSSSTTDASTSAVLQYSTTVNSLTFNNYLPAGFALSATTGPAPTLAISGTVRVDAGVTVAVTVSMLSNGAYNAFDIDSGAVLTVTQFTGTGGSPHTLNKVGTGQLVFNGNLNTQALNITAGNVTVNSYASLQSLTVDPAKGAFTLGAGGSLNFAGAGTVSGPLTLTGGCYVSFGGSQAIQSSLSASGTTRINVTGASTLYAPVVLNDTAVFSMTGTLPALGSGASFALHGSSTAFLTGGTLDGTVSVDSGATLVTYGGTYNGAWTLADGCTVNLQGGTIQPSGGVTIGGAGRIAMSSGTLNAGVTLNGASLDITGGSFGPNTSFAVKGTSSATLRSANTTNAAGTISVGPAASLTVWSGLYGGAWTIGDGAAITIYGGLFQPTGGIVASGTTVITSYSNNAPTYNAPVTLNGSAAFNMTANGSWGANASFALNGSSTATLRGSGTLNGAITVADGAFIRINTGGYAGPLTATGGSTVSIDSPNFASTGTITASGTSRIYMLAGSYPNLYSAIVLRDSASLYEPNGVYTYSGFSLELQNSATALIRGNMNGPIRLSGNTVLSTTSSGQLNGAVTLSDGSAMNVANGTINGNVTASGTSVFTLAAGSLYSVVTLNDNAIFNVTASSLTTSATTSFILRNSSSATVKGSSIGGAVFVDSGATLTETAGTYSGLWTLQPGATVNLNGGTITASGSLTARGTTRIALNGAKMNTRVNLYDSASLNMLGSQDIMAGASFYLYNSSTATLKHYNTNFTGAVYADSGATLTIAQGGYTGAWTLQPGCTVNLLNGTIQPSGGFSVSGTTVVKDSGAQVNAQVTLNGNAVFNMTANLTPGVNEAFILHGSSTANLSFNTYTLNGAISADGTSYLSLANGGTYNGSIALSGGAVGNFGPIKVVQPFSISGTAQVIASNATFSSTVTLNNSTTFTATGVVGQYQGLVWAKDTSNLILSGSLFNGGIRVGSSANATFNSGYIYNSITLDDGAKVTFNGAKPWVALIASGTTTISNTGSTFDSSPITLSGNAVFDGRTYGGAGYSTIALSGTSRAYIRGSGTGSGLYFANSATVSNSSQLTMYGFNAVTGSVALQNSGSASVFGLQGTISMDAGASLNLSGGTVTTDISDLIDTRTVTLGGCPVNYPLVLANTLNVAGSKTLNLVDWSDPTYGTPDVRLPALTGSGTIYRNGGLNAALVFGAAASASTWSGNVQWSNGIVGLEAEYLPTNLGKFVLDGANARLLINSPATYTPFSLNLGTNQEIVGTGQIVALSRSSTNYGSGLIDNYTMNVAGGVINPGGSPSAAFGQLTFRGNLEFSQNTTTGAYPQLTFDVAGSSYDQMVVTCSSTTGSGVLSSLNQANLVLNIGSADYTGQVLTLITSQNDLSLANHFRNVTWTGGYYGTVTYTGTDSQGAIVLSNIHISQSALAANPTSGTPISLGASLAPSATANLSDAVNLMHLGDPGTTLNITGVNISGDNAGLFSAGLNSGSTSLSYGSSATYNIGFAGTSHRGTYTASLLFTTDAQSGPNTASYDLSATVVASVLTASPDSGSSISFGSALAPSATVTLANAVTLTHTGDAGTTLNIIGVELSGTNAGLFSAALNTGSMSLAQGEFATYDLGFTGTATPGTYTASVLFTTNAQDGPQTATYSLTAIVAAANIPGDINRDHIVDQADYTVWYNHYGQTPATWADGDVTGDNIVDQADYTVWYNHYGQTGGNVPEPMTLALLAIGGLGLIRRRR